MRGIGLNFVYFCGLNILCVTFFIRFSSYVLRPKISITTCSLSSPLTLHQHKQVALYPYLALKSHLVVVIYFILKCHCFVQI